MLGNWKYLSKSYNVPKPLYDSDHKFVECSHSFESTLTKSIKEYDKVHYWLAECNIKNLREIILYRNQNHIIGMHRC